MEQIGSQERRGVGRKEKKRKRRKEQKVLSSRGMESRL